MIVYYKFNYKNEHWSFTVFLLNLNPRKVARRLKLKSAIKLFAHFGIENRVDYVFQKNKNILQNLSIKSYQ
jgi:hypothetical protein